MLPEAIQTILSSSLAPALPLLIEYPIISPFLCLHSTGPHLTVILVELFTDNFTEDGGADGTASVRNVQNE